MCLLCTDCRCWAIQGIQCLVRDPVASQWLEAVRASGSLGSQSTLYEPILRLLARLCQGLAQPGGAVDPVPFVDKLNVKTRSYLLNWWW